MHRLWLVAVFLLLRLGSEVGSWNNDAGRNETSLWVDSPLGTSSLAGTPDPGRVSKLVRDLIPLLNGRNMSVKMFVEHCRAAISIVTSWEMPYLTMLVKTEITSEARVHIYDRIGIKLQDILKILERIHTPQEDASQLLQDLTNVERKTNETIP